MFTPNHYVVAGIADANGHPHQPEKLFDSFFSTGEYFKHVEFGWIGSWDNRYEDNAHVTLWQQDAREDVGVRKGRGVALSFSRALERWLPFVRAG